MRGLPGQRLRSDEKQGLLLEGSDHRYLRSYKHGAQVIGDWFEEATASLFELCDARRLKTDSNCTCPDLREGRAAEFYIESKAAGPRGRVYIIYLDNLRRYVEVIEQALPPPEMESADKSPVFLFALWKHSIKDIEKHFKWEHELRSALCEAILQCVIIDMSVAKCLLTGKREEGCENPQTANDSVYPPFKRIRVSDLNHLRDNDPAAFADNFNMNMNRHRLRRVSAPALNVYGETTCGFPLHVFVSEEVKWKPSLQMFFDWLEYLGKM